MACVERANARPEEPPDLVPARRDHAAEDRQADADVQLPGGTPRRAGDRELERSDRPARPHDPSELAQRRAGIVDVAEEVRERHGGERRVRKRERFRPAPDQLDPVGEAGRGDALATRGEHLRTLVDPDDAAPGTAHELDRDRRGPGGDVKHAVVLPRFDARDEEPAPARVLAEREEAAVTVVRLAEGREQTARLRVPGGNGLGHSGESKLGSVGLSEELGRIAGAARSFSVAGEAVVGVLAAEPASGERVYLCAFEGERGRTWLALDAGARPLESRQLVREAVSITALCELAGETAGGGELEELRSRLVTLRVTENPEGIEAAEEAALALEAAIGSPPHVASPGYLDEIGAATRRLELALGTNGVSPFAEAMKQGVGAVEALTSEVETSYKRPLR
jgi:hypothetical protein